MIVADVLGGLLGVLLVFPALVGVSYLLWTTSSCPIANGRECNGNGRCVDGRVCACDVLFSGIACEQTQVLGYVAETNAQCNGMGVASPFMQLPDLLDVCRESTPSFANAFRKGENGWRSAKCTERTQQARKRIEAGVYTEKDLRSTPVCLCRAPFGGPDCSINLCPAQIATGEICSGNGNRSVGFMRNNTNVGLGCQCENRVTLKQLLSLLSQKQLQLLAAKYTMLFAEGVCGQVFPGPLFVPSRIDFKCYCADKYYGEVCEFGKCPMAPDTKRHCSGMGHPSFGFGAEKNTTRAISAFGEACTPICKDGNAPCPVCLPSQELCHAGVGELECPPERPYRCSNKRCYSGTESFCQFPGYTAGVLDRPKPKTCNSVFSCVRAADAVLGVDSRGIARSVFGTLDDLNDTLSDTRAPTSAPTFATGAQLSTQVQQRFIPLGVRNLTSPLVLLSMFVHTGSVRVTLHHWSRAQSAVQHVDARGPSAVSIAFDMGLQQERVMFEEEGWRVNVSLAARANVEQRERRLWYVEPSPVQSPDDATTVPDEFLVVRLHDARRRAYFVMDCEQYDAVRNALLCASRVKDADLASENQEQNAEWVLQRSVSERDAMSRFFLEFTSSADASVSSVAWISVADTRKPCICPPQTMKNESVLNAVMVGQSFRSSRVKIGGPAVALVTSQFGDVHAERGIMLSEDVMRVKYTNALVEVSQPKSISKAEYARGVPTCNDLTHPFRCPDFGCAGVVVHEPTPVPVTCSCELGALVPASASEARALFGAAVGAGTVGVSANTQLRTQNNVDVQCVCRDFEMSNQQEYACGCTSFGCVCDTNDHVFETHLFDTYLPAPAHTCVVLPPFRDDEDENDAAAPVAYVKQALQQQNSTAGPITDMFARVLPLEFRIENATREPCEHIHVFARMTSSDDFQPVDIECFGPGNSTFVPLIDHSVPFEQWRLVNVSSDNVNITRFAPYGIPFYMTRPHIGYVVTASFDEASARAALVKTDANAWESQPDHESFVQIEFNESLSLTGVLLVIETLGVPVVGFRNLNVSAHVDVDGTRVAKVFSDVYNATGSDAETVFVRFAKPTIHSRRVRLSSYFPIRLRVFLPMTDQACTIVGGRLYATPESHYVLPSTENSAVDVVTDYEADCVCSDTCVLAGASAANDGVCSDFEVLRRATPETDISTTRTFLGAASALDFVLVPFENTTTNTTQFLSSVLGVATVETSTHVFYWNRDFISAPWNVSEVDAEFRLARRGALESPSVGFDYFFPSVALAQNQSYYGVAFLQKRNTTVVRASQNTTADFFGDEIQYGLLVNGQNACPTGTDCTDCGAAPRYVARSVCRNQLQTLRRPISEWVFARNFRLAFSFTHVRNVSRIGRGPCGDCDGRHRCKDGTCVNTLSECAETRHDCPGDGCVQADVNRREFKCACRPGHSGLDCSYRQCTPLDVLTGFVDPHRACSCGAFPPLKRRPPFSERKRRRDYTIRDLLRLNRDGPRTALNDVGWVNVSGTFAPYGYAFYWTYYENGKKIYTNCEPRVRDPLGVLRTLEECVEERDPDNPRLVTKWRRFPLGNGSFTEIMWRTEIDFNHAPYRCANNYRCVATERDCYITPHDELPCGTPLSLCLTDGMCQCEPGRETFVINPTKTKEARIPYYSVDGVSNPLVWNSPTEIDLRQYAYLQCKARNCSETDCSPPTGCFAGTPKLLLADKLIPCDFNSGHFGTCGVDVKACERGDVVPPLECWGNGILRQIDYRPDEYTCQCGGPRSHLVSSVSQVRATTELVPNGFGGTACSEYFCQGALNTPIFFQRINPVTRTYYVGRDLLPLPGIWRGPCDAPVGPQIEDLSDWQNCCPGIKRLEKCDRVLCDVGSTSEKTTQCLPIDECTGAERIPRVYSCNNHGKALADGTCECDRDETQGTGFTSDLSVFSYEGCFARVQCLQDASGRVCHATRGNERFDLWSEFPKIPYAEQQPLVFAFLQGLPMTNRTLVEMAARGLHDFDNNVLLVAFSNIAERVANAIATVQSTVCVYPNETSANPFGMVPYVGRESVVGPYMKSFTTPFLLNVVQATATLRAPAPVVRAILFDGDFVNDIQTENVDVVRLQTSVLFQDSFNVTFDGAFTLSAVRVHAAYIDNIEDRTAPLVARLQFLSGDTGRPVCGELELRGSAILKWQGESNAHYCVPEYLEYVFALRDPTSFLTECKNDETAETCLAWKDARCAQVGGVVNEPGNFTNLFLGCNNGRCCVPKFGATPLDTQPTTRVVVRLLRAPNSNNHNVYVDEIQFYGHPRVAVPRTKGLEDEMTARNGASACVDERYVFRVMGEDRSYYVFRNWTGFAGVSSLPPARIGLNYAAARDLCDYSSGVMATSRGAENAANYALFFGLECFSNAGLSSDLASGSLQDRGCLLDAKNRNDRRAPPMADFFEDSCSQHGCWTPVSSGDYVAQRPAPSRPFTSYSANYYEFIYCTDSYESCVANLRGISALAMEVQSFRATFGIRHTWDANTVRNGFTPYFGDFDRTPHVFSDPFDDGGYQWQVPWNAFQKPWPEVFRRFAAEQLEQFGRNNDASAPGLISVNGVVMHRDSPHFVRAEANTPLADKFGKLMFGNGYATGLGRYFGCASVLAPGSLFSTNLKTRCRSAFPGHLAAKMDPDTAFEKENNDGEITTYWTNPEVCVVTFYSDFMCGRLTGGDRRNGAKYTVRITPQNMYTWRRFGLASGLVFDKCAVDESRTDCDMLGSMLVETKSISITGNCQVIVRGRGYNTEGVASPVTASNPIIVTLFGQRANEQTDSNTRPMPGTRAHGFAYMDGTRTVQPNDPITGLWPGDCQVNFFRSGEWTTDFFVDNAGMFGRTQANPDATYTFSTNLAPLKQSMVSFTIVPRFTSRLVRVISKMPKRSSGLANAADNAFSMGYRDQPYMCGNVVVQVLARVFGGANAYVRDDESVRESFELENVVWGTHADDGSMLIRESRPNGRGVTYREAVTLDTGVTFRDRSWTQIGDSVSDSTLEIPVRSCDGTSVPRRVRRCRDCIKLQPPGDYQWNQRFFNPANSLFQTGVLAMRQTSVNLNEPVRPQVHVSFSTSTFFDGQFVGTDTREYVPLASLELQNPYAYARLIAKLRPSDYRLDAATQTNTTQAAFYLDQCVRCVRNPIGSQLNFSLDTAVCEDPSFRVLCIRTLQKHVVQSGRQCDACGPNSCQKLNCAGETAFTLFPLANSSLFPFEHEVYQASERGELNLLVQNQQYDADVIMAYLSSLPQSLILAFDLAREYLVRGVSTRPGVVSRGQQENKLAWVDMNFARWFPYDCGQVFSKLTGVPRERVAVSAQYCDPDFERQYAGSQMAQEDVPTVFLPFSGNVRLERSCGKLVKPASFLVRDENGGPASIESRNYAVFESTDDYVILKFWRGNGTFRNTGKRQGYVFRGDAVITGNVACDANAATACVVDVMVSTLSPSYGDPASSLVFGTVFGSGDFELVPSAGVQTQLNSGAFAYQVLWFVVKQIQPLTTIKLSNMLVTDDASTAKCRRDQTPVSYVELPSSVDSPHPVHVCVYSKRQALEVGAIGASGPAAVGQCYCSDSSPFGGPSCEWPAVISFRGKHVCNAYGDFSSLAYARTGELVRVQGDSAVENAPDAGVYVYDDSPALSEFVYQCKCRGDLGKIIRTRLDALSVYDFQYVLRTDNLPNAPLFVSVPQSVIEDEIEIAYPVSEDDILSVCQSQSASLPSFINAEELVAFLGLFNPNYPQTAMVLDFAFEPSTAQFRWQERSHLVFECATEDAAACGSDADLHSICPNSTLCGALNWNNVAFRQTNTTATDGRNVSALMSVPFTVPLNRTLTSASVDLFSDDPTLYGNPLSITMQPSATVCTYLGRDNQRHSYTCAAVNGIVSLVVTRFSLLAASLRELAVYDGQDNSRPFGLFD